MLVDDSSIKLTTAQTPRHFRTVADGEMIRLRSGPFQVTARCNVSADGSEAASRPALAGPLNPRLAPWKLGFLQAQVLEVSWAYYRSREPDAGCVLNDMARRREIGICRDYKPSSGVIWYEGSDNIFDCYGLPGADLPPPWKLVFYFGDNPSEKMYPHVLNQQTQRYNYLNEARCSLAFVTTLSEQVSEGVYKHHRHFFWSAVWHIKATASEPRATDFKLQPGSGFWISAFKTGGPKDARYQAALTAPPTTPSCNDVANEAPVEISTASDWRRFPLMDEKDPLFQGS